MPVCPLCCLLEARVFYNSQLFHVLFENREPSAEQRRLVEATEGAIKALYHCILKGIKWKAAGLLGTLSTGLRKMCEAFIEVCPLP